MVTVRKSRCCYLKLTLLAENCTFLAITAGYYPQKTTLLPQKKCYYQKKQVITKEKKSHCYQKNHRITQKKHIITKPPGILMENLEIVIIKPDIIT